MMEDENLKVVLEPGAYLPERAHATDAGLDLRTRYDVKLWGGESATFDTGVHIALDSGTYGKIESKSGLNVNQGIVACGGVIDEGYTGSIVVKLYNLTDRSYQFHAGDKIAQIIISEYCTPDIELVSELPETERNSSGFGSSGR